MAFYRQRDDAFNNNSLSSHCNTYMIWARSVNIFPKKRDNKDYADISFNPKNRCESECVYTVCPKTGNLEKPFLCE